MIFNLQFMGKLGASILFSDDFAAEIGVLFAKRLKPPADVNLRVGLAAVVPCVRRIGGFPCPFEYRQLRIAALDHNPTHRMVALFAANFTSINCIDH